MARSKIQFQPGISLTEFLQQYGAEEQCRQSFFCRPWPNDFICPACGQSSYRELKSRILFQCNHCHTLTSLTSGTIFASTKLSVVTYFFGICLVTQSKTSVPALSASRTLGVAGNTALLMKYKLQQVFKLRDDSQPLASLVQIEDSYWRGKKRSGNRSRGATRKIPFTGAVESSDQVHLLNMIRFTRVRSFPLRLYTPRVAHHVAPGSHVISDGHGCFK
ncbi:MAG: IS1595 family transposase [Bacteroidales bacterium]|nr:IS1595 family transposase [Bacteroidales bacterium]